MTLYGTLTRTAIAHRISAVLYSCRSHSFLNQGLSIPIYSLAFVFADWAPKHPSSEEINLKRSEAKAAQKRNGTQTQMTMTREGAAR